MVRTQDPEADSPSESPRVFISHRHHDSAIADVLRNFIRGSTAGAVEVFQSSYSGSGPEIGNLLTDALGKELDLAQVVILVFTVPDADWSYCMWETGVAFNPRRKDTRIVVLQCGDNVPAPLSDRTRVRVSDEESIKTMVKQLLTDDDFFPGLGKAVTRFGRDSEEVGRHGEKLFKELQAVVPAEPEDSWPAWPWLQLEFPLDQIAVLRTAMEENREAEADSCMKEHCRIEKSDRFAGQLFGTPSLRVGSTLGELAADWAANNRDSDSRWLNSLLSQLKKASLWQFPPPDWALFRHADSPRWYAPMLLHVRKSPSRGCMQFDCYFPRFEVDDGAGTVDCHLPSG